MSLFGRRPDKTLRQYVAEFHRPMVELGGVKDCPSYHGVLLEVLADAYLLVNCQIGSETQKGVTWVPAQGAVVVDRNKVLFLQLLNGGPG